MWGGEYLLIVRKDVRDSFAYARKLYRNARILASLSFCFIFACPSHLLAQGGFERMYGSPYDDWGSSVQQTSDGGYIITGYSDLLDTGDGNVYLVKTDANGDTLWTKDYGGSDYDEAYSVRQTRDGGYIIAGFTSSFGAGKEDVYLIKTDANGNELWTKTYGGRKEDWAHSVQQTQDGGYILVGETESFGDVSGNVYLIKTDASGDSVWARTYGGSRRDWGFSVDQTPDGGYILAGFTSSYGAGNDDVYLVKTDAIGDTVWTRTFGGTYSEWGYSVQATEDGGYIVTGWQIPFVSGNHDVYLIKTDAVGGLLWERTYGGSESDVGHSVQQTLDGGYIVAGYTQSFGAGGRDVYLIKTDDSGDTLWTETYGGSGFDACYHVEQTVDGDFVGVGGTTSFGAGGSDIYLVKAGICGPVLLGAEASDNVNPIPGIDNDDQVFISFDESTNMPSIDASNIDSILSLSGGHTWTDVFGTIGSAVWNPPGDGLLVTLSTNGGPPNVAIGDTITPDGVTITGLGGCPTRNSIVIAGTFDPPTGTGNRDEMFEIPKIFDLCQNYPNPFNPMTTIEFTIPEDVSGKASLMVYDVRGRLIKTLADGNLAPARYTMTWNGRNDQGETVASGIYLYQLTAGDRVATRKLLVLR